MRHSNKVSAVLEYVRVEFCMSEFEYLQVHKDPTFAAGGKMIILPLCVLSLALNVFFCGEYKGLAFQAHKPHITMLSLFSALIFHIHPVIILFPILIPCLRAIFLFYSLLQVLREPESGVDKVANFLYKLGSNWEDMLSQVESSTARLKSFVYKLHASVNAFTHVRVEKI